MRTRESVKTGGSIRISTVNLLTEVPCANVWDVRLRRYMRHIRPDDLEYGVGIFVKGIGTEHLVPLRVKFSQSVKGLIQNVAFSIRDQVWRFLTRLVF